MLRFRKLVGICDFRACEFSSTAPFVKNICIVGSGLMGSGIAQVAAQASIMVTLVDKSDAALNKSEKYIQNNLERLTKKQCKDVKTQASIIENVMEKIMMTKNLEQGVQKADLVIEAIIENLPMKQKLFERIEAVVARPILLASNTSSLRLQDIARKLKNRSRFGGLHFFNPVPIMKLCEVVRLTETSDDTFNALQTFGKTVGKTTVACKDVPGFIVNRLLIPYLIEAIRMTERGDASPRDIDTAMKLGAGYPMGPFELLDYVGLDTAKFILDGWHESYPNEKQFDPNPTLNKLVAEGKLGKKSGEGFYSYK